MKVTLVFLSFLLFSICTHSFFCLAVERPDPVLDIDGKPLQVGVEYYIRYGQIGDDSLTSAGLGNETCPPLVVPVRYALDKPATFKAWNSGEHIVHVSAAHNIKFSAKNDCNEPNVWNRYYDESIGKHIIHTNGVERDLGPGTIDNWFKIEKYNSDYKLVFCPIIRDYRKIISKDLGTFLHEGGQEIVVLTDGEPLTVRFEKKTRISM